MPENNNIKISGFSYVRNGFTYGVPFIEAITSILPICHEMVVAVGDSNDGTREAIQNLNNDKIKIIDTVWDMNLREGGKIFAIQTNIALAAITGNWAFHIQADEVIHEEDLPKIVTAIEQENSNPNIDGFILPFLHFWADYRHIRNSRRVHNNEVRIFRNDKLIQSYRDSQGFRKYKSVEGYMNSTDTGKKLLVKKIDAPVYHYNGVRNSRAMHTKIQNFQLHYGNIIADNKEEENNFDFNWVDRVAPFTKTHPAVMEEKIKAHNFSFVHDTSKAIWKPKDKWIQPIEDILGFKFGEYKNYILKK
jgi:Glycosyl transferase family 2